VAEVTARFFQSHSLQRGTSLIEVLVSVIIVAIGLLGLAGLQSRMQAAEMDSYERSQALVLLDDMASRIETNRTSAASYVTTASSPVGAGMTCPAVAAGSTRQQIDTHAWCLALQGAAEDAGGTKTGAMIGGRGCVESLPNNEYLVTVAWQGLVPLSAPPTGVACGSGLYNDADQCTGDLCRRVVTTVVRIGNLK
jgi:type IV pilus assembly protein PilV